MHRARIRGPRLHPAHRLRPFFISSLLMSNILQRDLTLALISSTYHLDPPASKPSPRSWLGAVLVRRVLTRDSDSWSSFWSSFQYHMIELTGIRFRVLYTVGGTVR